MRDSAFRAAAVILGVLGVPSVLWQVHRAWPLDQMGLYFFGGQALILFVFLGYGLGFGTMKSGYQASQPKEPGVEELPADETGNSTSHEGATLYQDRIGMRFSAHARNALEFLEKDHGYSRVNDSTVKTIYESAKVRIAIFHGIRDCEVGITFGRLAMQENYSFSLFLQLVNPVLEKSLGDRMADKPETVAATVSALAEALRLEGQGIIHGDDEVFERMKDVRWWHFCPEALG